MTKRILKVIIIDDEKDICKNFHDFFEDYPEFHTTSFLSAEEALADFTETDCPDICIVDMRLSGMRGDEFIYRARTICRKCRFLICTGSIDMVLTPTLREIGMTEKDIFFKPADMFKIINRIREIYE